MRIITISIWVGCVGWAPWELRRSTHTPHPHAYLTDAHYYYYYYHYCYYYYYYYYYYYWSLVNKWE